ncbi:hypothetical protein [Aquitalea magnusonii]|uniref:hypothetical protein n=1 Tax=Aquitalea magnusonii TaxID=332411 RepID=UPI0011B428F6|nr:hypothetical protein [Aquitalea magnusonii]
MRVFIVVGVIAALVGVGVWVRGAVDRPVIASAKADVSAARGVTVAVQNARVIEHKVAASDAAASAEYQKGLSDGKKDLDGALARLRAAARLRDQQLAAVRAGKLPAAIAGSGRRDASAPGDFLAAHGDAALRLAAEADDVVKQLQACQVVVSSGRENSNN